MKNKYFNQSSFKALTGFADMYKELHVNHFDLHSLIGKKYFMILTETKMKGSYYILFAKFEGEKSEFKSTNNIMKKENKSNKSEAIEQEELRKNSTLQ